MAARVRAGRPLDGFLSVAGLSVIEAVPAD
jgi:hypothetical protein